MRVYISDGGRHLQGHGYGRVAHSIVNALGADDRIATIGLVPPAPAEADPYERFAGREKHLFCPDPGEAQPDVVIHVGPPSSIRGGNIPSVAYTMMDVHGVPQDWAARLSRMRAIITPSRTSAASFARDLDVPTAVVPLYVDSVPFNVRRHWRAEGRSKMSFIFVGTFSYRKNIRTLLKAFLREFDHAEAGLTIVCTESEPDSVLAGTLGAMRDVGKVGDIEIVTKRLSDAWLARYYARHDAFVTMTRGEGWGYPGLEAACCGIPVVAPSNTSMDMYLNPASTVFVPSRPMRVDDIVEAEGGNFKARYASGDCTMVDVKLNEAQDALRRAFDMREALTERAEISAPHTRATFSPTTFRDNLVSSILNLI